jgi:hypothetical protein
VADVEILAILVATAAAFALGGLYYGVLGEQLADVSAAAPSPAGTPAWKLGVELLRCLVLAVVVAALAAGIDADTPLDALLLGLCLWTGFPLVLWVGAVIHENTPLKLAVIHAGDWLVKLLAIAAIVGAIQ